VAEVARITAWLADASAGQCGPCVHGLASIAGELNAIWAGEADAGALAQLERWSGLVAGRGACAHPDGAATFVSSAVRVFATELTDHAQYGPCDACDGPPVLVVPQRFAAAGRR
jgi:NADH:ubiquinone oxidoreductase subunit F (NADH-binding)